MITVVENGHSDPSLSSGTAVCVLHIGNILRKGVHPTVLPPAMSK